MAVQFKRRKKIILPLIVISILTITTILIGLYLAQKLAKYQYGVTVSEYPLPETSTPTKTDIVITYYGKKPKEVDIKIIRPNDSKTYSANAYSANAHYTYDDENKKIYITYDVNTVGYQYYLQVKPADNELISVEMEQFKSEVYINAGIEVTEDKNGLPIATIINYDDELSLTVHQLVTNSGKSYSKWIDDLIVAPGETCVINVSKYASKYPNASRLEININDGTDKQSMRDGFDWN